MKPIDDSSADTTSCAATFDREPLLHDFEEAWQGGAAPAIESILERVPADGSVAESARRRLLEELVKIDLEYRWRGVAPAADDDLPANPLLEDYVRRYPSLGSLELLPPDAIGEEYRVRWTWGDRPDAETYRARFPQQAELLSPLLARIDAERRQACVQTTLATASVHGTPSRLTPDGYELLEEVGRGGMGVVYKARQARLNRLVALKMIRAGEWAGVEERARFRTEVEAAARVQHPHIVQVYEVGEQDGQPFCVMEFVNGGSLAHRLAGTPLEARAAARLLETLAQAVQAVHEQGILHRDLKPANILLASGGRQPSVDSSTTGGLRPPLADCIAKISDFGLAKQVEEAGLTQTGAVLGTPSYMAPEQAEGRTRDIGPATDVYGLGAILYELLTGRPPFRGVSVLETLEQVRNRDPLPPRQLQPAVPREIDLICLKCLHKEPSQRYASAADLARDLERFRLHQPIHARPAGRWERGVKWTRRHPALTTLSAALVLGVAAALAGALIYTVHLRAANAETQRQQELSARHYRKALQSIEQMLVRMGAQRMTAIPGTEQLQEDALHDAIKLYQELQAEQKEPDPDLYAQLGFAFTYLGHLQMGLGRPDEAETNGRRGLELLESLPPELRETTKCRHQLAFGRYILGNILAAKGQHAETERLYRMACDVLEPLAAGGDKPSRRLLSDCYMGLGGLPGNLATRMDFYRRSLALTEALHAEDPADWEQCNRLGQSLYNVAVIHQKAGRTDDAERVIQRCISLLEPLASREPRRGGEHADRAMSQSTLANAYNCVAMLHAGRGQADKSEAYYKKAIALCEDMVRLYPHPARREELALSCANLAALYQTSNRNHKEVEKLHRKVLAIREPLARDLPQVIVYRHRLAETYVNLALLLGVSRPEEARLFQQKARELLESLLRDRPNDMGYTITLGSNYSNEAMFVRGRGQPRKALPWHDRAVEVLSAAHRRDPAHAGCRYSLVMALGARAATWTQLSDHKKALADWDRLLEAAGADEADKYRWWRGMTLARLGDHRRSAADIDKALRRKGIPNGERFNCVCVLSLAIAAARSDTHLSPAEREKAADGYAALALDALSRLREVGHFKTVEAVVNLAADPDLAALRARDDFKRWCRGASKP